MIVSEGVVSSIRIRNYIFGLVCSGVACLIILADWRGLLGGPMIFITIDAVIWESQLRRLLDEKKFRGPFEVQEY